MDIAEAERVVQRLVASWDARDLEALVACLSDDVEWYDPAMPDPPARGRAAVRAFAEAVIRAFPDFRYEVLPPMMPLLSLQRQFVRLQRQFICLRRQSVPLPVASLISSA